MPASTSTSWCASCGALIDVDVHCMGEPREGATAHSEHDPRLAGANAALSDPLRRPVDGGGGRPDAVDLVHSHTWYANMAGHLAEAAVRRPARRHRALAGAAAAVEGRAARRRLPGLVLGRAHGVRGRRRGRRGEPPAWPTTCSRRTRRVDPARVHVIHNGIDTELLPARPGHRRPRAARRRPRPALPRVRRPDHPAEGRAAPAARRAAARPVGPAGAARRRRGHPGAQGRDRRRRSPSCAPRATASSWSPRCCRARRSARCSPTPRSSAARRSTSRSGIVNLEAMACETAVVASRVGRHPRGRRRRRDRAARRPRPRRPRGLRAAARRGGRRAGRATRTRAAAHGPGRARAGRSTEFGWAAVAARTVELYRVAACPRWDRSRDAASRSPQDLPLRICYRRLSDRRPADGQGRRKEVAQRESRRRRRADPVVGRCAVPALDGAGHEVVDVGPDRVGRSSTSTAMARPARAATRWSTSPPRCRSGSAPRWRRAWRAHDLLALRGRPRLLVGRGRGAGVRRVVQQSVSFVYADQGEDWVTEESPVCVTSATEPASVGELAVQDFAVARAAPAWCCGWACVIGDCGLTRWSLRAAARGRPVGAGSPDGYVHVIHSDDVGTAVVAALDVAVRRLQRRVPRRSVRARPGGGLRRGGRPRPGGRSSARVVAPARRSAASSRSPARCGSARDSFAEHDRLGAAARRLRARRGSTRPGRRSSAGDRSTEPTGTARTPARRRGARAAVAARSSATCCPRARRDDRDRRTSGSGGDDRDDWLRRNVPPHHG